MTDCCRLQDHYVRNAGFRKPKYPTAPHPKGYPNADQLKKRPIEEILADYVKLIREHKDDFPDQEGLPVFLPARRPGPVMPSEESIAAFNKLVVGDDQLNEYRELILLTRSPLVIKTLQRYVLSPTDINYQHARDLLDDFRLFVPLPVARTPRPARKTFEPLLVDQPFESSPTYRTVFASQSSWTTQPAADQQVVTFMEELIQFGAIVGTQLPIDVLLTTAKCAAHGEDIDHWSGGYFENGLGLLPQIYLGESSHSLSSAVCVSIVQENITSRFEGLPFLRSQR